MPANNSDSLKSSQEAEAARSAGNKLYVERSFFDALLKYNESLCVADVRSEAVGLAYANRSAVYFELKLFDKSLSNIQLAKSNNYPEKNFPILDKRTEKCHEQIKAENVTRQDTSPYDFIKLSDDANPTLPFVASCLELKTSEKFGRFIITNRDIKVGEIVAIETPHFRVLKSDQRYERCQQFNKFQRCSFCLEDNLMDLIPCEGCSSAMFCSEKCSLLSMNSFHIFECPINDLLLKSGIMQMAMRVFFQALAMFGGSIDNLEQFLMENEKPGTSVYDFDLSEANEEFIAKSNLLSLFHLARNQSVCPNDSPENFLKHHPLLSSQWQSHESFIRSFIQRVLQVGDSNFHGICGWSFKKYENQIPQMIGIGCYPFISLVNHSCAPNVNRIYVDNKMLLLVERPIKKGEQLFDCYKTTFFTQPKPDRQRELLESYSFKCDCVACTRDFPLYHGLKSVDKKIHKLAKKGKDELSKLDVAQAKKRFREYCDAIQKHHEKGFPSSEIVLLQECVLQCISIIIKPKLLFP